MSALPTPDIGAIIPSAKGRKIAYAIFAAVSILVGDAVIFAATVYGEPPVWLIGISAVLNNTAPVFASIAIANAKTPTPVEETVVEDVANV